MAAEDDIPELLRDTLDNLDSVDFKRFRHSLDDLKEIPWGRLEKADTDETVKLMQKHFKSSQGAATTMLAILKKMRHNELAGRLESGLKGLVKDEPSQPSKVPVQVDSKMAAAFVDTNRAKIIERVAAVMPIADQLLSQGIIGEETYANISAAGTSQDKMRRLYDGLRSPGAPGKLAFYKILMVKEPYLVEELQTAA